MKVINSHSHGRIVFGSHKFDTFRNFCLLKNVEILSKLILFEAKIVLIKQFDKPHIELVTLTQFLSLAGIEKISVRSKIVYFTWVLNYGPNWFKVLYTGSIHHKRPFQLECVLLSFNSRHSFEFAQRDFFGLYLADLSGKGQFFIIR